MELYKVLECKDGKLISPYQYYEYIPGKKMICSDFDTNELKDCSRGYYATDIDGLIYTYGFEIQKILLVPHGGIHNDTIVTVEIKTQRQCNIFT